MIDYGRVGYPTMLVIHPSGTVAGRFSVSKAYANLDYVTNRIEQALQADPWDEPDNFWQTATAKLLLRDELVEMPFAEYSKAEWNGALTSDGMDWFYGKTAPSSAENALRSCPLEGEATELAYSVRGPAIVEVRAKGQGEIALQLQLDGNDLTNGFPVRVAVPTGRHSVVLAAQGDGSAFVQADFRTVYLAEYKLQADNPRDGRRLSVSENMTLSSAFVDAASAVEPGVTVVTRIGATSRLTDLPFTDADVLTPAGYVYPQGGEQRTALLDFAWENLGKPFWAGCYTIPETLIRESGGPTSKVTVQTPFGWQFE